MPWKVGEDFLLEKATLQLVERRFGQWESERGT